MKTLRQIAGEIGISKSTVYRYVKSQGIEPSNIDANKMSAPRYDDAVESRIITHFFEEGDSVTRVRRASDARHGAPCDARHDDIIDALLTQLDALHDANRILAETNKTLAEALKASQTIHAMDIKRLTDGASDARHGLFSRIFRRKP